MLMPEQIDAHVARIERDGYTIIENAMPADVTDTLSEDLLRLEKQLGIVPAANPFEGAKTFRIYNLLVHGALYEAIPVNDNALPVVERVLDPGCLVSSLSSIGICPGEKAQPIHADDQLLPLPKPHPAVVCNTMWAITDFTAENGATRVIPGSHKADGSPEFMKHYDSVPAEMAKGSVLVYHGSLWHGGGANRSAGRRVGIAMNYCAGYIRQQENQQLGIPREIVAHFSPRLQALVGYGLYNGLIGHINKTSPVTLLGRSPDGRMLWEM